MTEDTYSTHLPPTAPDRRDQQLQGYRFLESLQESLAGCRDNSAVYSTAAHRIAAAFSAQSVCLAINEPVSGSLSIVHQVGAASDWNMDQLLRAAETQRTVFELGTLAVPVVQRDALSDRRCWGVVAVRRSADGGQAFPPTDRQVLRSAAQRLAGELERRRLYLLDDVLDGLLRKTKPIDVYTHVLRELRRFVRYDHSASVLTMQRGVAQVTVRAEKVVMPRGRKESLMDSLRLGKVVRLTAPQTRYLERLQAPMEVRREDDRYVVVGGSDPDAAGLWRAMSLNGSSGEGSILCYPLIFGEQVLGVLRLAATRADAFVEIDTRAVERFARLLSVTLYRSELYHQSDRQLEAIKQIGRIITEPISVEEVCRQVLQLALRVLNVEVGAVGLINDDGALQLKAHQGCTLAELPMLFPGEGIAGAVVHTGQSRAVPDVSREPSYVLFNGRVRSELVAPITYNQEVIGFLDVESFEEGRFRPEDEEGITFVEALANQAAIAIKTAQLHDAARERLGAALAIDPSLSMAGLQDLLIDELRDKIEQLAAANDRLAAANQAKSEFLAQMSHDLRGPLNVIVGLSNLLADPAVASTLSEEGRREHLELIRSNGERLSSLIGNILDLSALEAGRVSLDVAPFPADRAFEYLAALTRTLATESHKELDISVRLDEGVRTIEADEDKFLRVLQNLLFNAVKFTPSGGQISIVVRAAEREGYAGSGAGRDLHITVADTGAGIAPEDRERVFLPFQQVESADARHYHGTGLGLTVVRQLVEMHGGRVWLESTPGVGSDFHVVFPDALPDSDGEEALAVSAEPEERARPAGSLDRRTVLVVEDIPAHMSMMRLAITSRGYDMHGVGTGAEALRWLEDHRPDLILLDMQLPDTDGFSLAARIKSRVETHAVPLIAVSADALSVTEERALAAGCDAYLTKPIDIGMLLRTMETVTA